MRIRFYHYHIMGLCLLLSACFNPDKYDDIKPQGIISLVTKSGGTMADGKSKFELKAEISHDASVGRRTVTFKTSLGSFAGGSGDSIQVLADESFICTAYLTSVKKGTAEVTATIRGVKAEDKPQITFSQAYPTRITARVDSFAVKANFQSEAVLSASLNTENDGVPTIGYLVTFNVTDPAGNQVGVFLNNINTSKTDEQGKATIRYSAGNSTYTGPLIVTASTAKENGQPVSATTQLFLTH